MIQADQNVLSCHLLCIKFIILWILIFILTSFYILLLSWRDNYSNHSKQVLSYCSCSSKEVLMGSYLLKFLTSNTGEQIIIEPFSFQRTHKKNPSRVELLEPFNHIILCSTKKRKKREWAQRIGKTIKWKWKEFFLDSCHLTRKGMERYLKKKKKKNIGFWLWC
jgi:hypothetical protein